MVLLTSPLRLLYGIISVKILPLTMVNGLSNPSLSLRFCIITCAGQSWTGASPGSLRLYNSIQWRLCICTYFEHRVSSQTNFIPKVHLFFPYKTASSLSVIQRKNVIITFESLPPLLSTFSQLTNWVFSAYSTMRRNKGIVVCLHDIHKSWPRYHVCIHIGTASKGLQLVLGKDCQKSHVLVDYWNRSQTP